MRYEDRFVRWLNTGVETAYRQEIARIVEWYNYERIYNNWPHMPHEVSEKELLQRLSRRLRCGLHGFRVDMHIEPNWDEAQKLRSEHRKCITLEFQSGRYVLGVKSKRDIWDGLGYFLTLAQRRELWKIRQCEGPGCKQRWFAAGDYSQVCCSTQCRQRKYARSDKGKKSNAIRQARERQKTRQEDELGWAYAHQV